MGVMGQWANGGLRLLLSPRARPALGAPSASSTSPLPRNLSLSSSTIALVARPLLPFLSPPSSPAVPAGINSLPLASAVRVGPDFAVLTPSRSSPARPAPFSASRASAPDNLPRQPWPPPAVTSLASTTALARRSARAPLVLSSRAPICSTTSRLPSNSYVVGHCQPPSVPSRFPSQNVFNAR